MHFLKKREKSECCFHDKVNLFTVIPKFLGLQLGLYLFLNFYVRPLSQRTQRPTNKQEAPRVLAVTNS